MGVCNCSVFCCMLVNVHSSIAIILMGKRELVALLYLSSWCLVIVEWLFLAVPWGCLGFVIVVFPDHTHLLFIESTGIVFLPFTPAPIVANRKLASRNKPVAFRSVHTGIEPPFLLKINHAITACKTLGLTFRKY